MANTTNFGWETPDDTDLVKDGAAAMRTLGNSIDASFVDLKGGTTGQVLSKTSNTDLDFTWVNGGDITEVTAGVGISGGGTSGAVTITNSMATAIDAKGDLVAGTGADTFSRLAVGSNNTVLTADSTTATGLKWATPAAPNASGVMCYRTTNVTLSNGVVTTIDFTAEFNDTDAYHSNTTNPSRLTVPAGKAGYYWVFCTSVFDDTSTTGGRLTYIRATVSSVATNYYSGGTGSPVNQGDLYHNFGVFIYLGVGDYVELRALQQSGGNLDYIGDGTVSRFGMYLVGA